MEGKCEWCYSFKCDCTCGSAVREIERLRRELAGSEMRAESRARAACAEMAKELADSFARVARTHDDHSRSLSCDRPQYFEGAAAAVARAAERVRELATSFSESRTRSGSGRVR